MKSSKTDSRARHGAACDERGAREASEGSRFREVMEVELGRSGAPESQTASLWEGMVRNLGAI